MGAAYRRFDSGIEVLRHAEVFARLTEEDLKPLAEVSECRWYRRGEMIVPRLPQEDGIFVITRGGVRIYLMSERGRELTLFRRRAGAVFELGTVDSILGDEVVAEALMDRTVVYAVPWLRFLQVVSSQPDAAASLAEFMLHRRAEERRLLREFAFHTMRARLACRLVELAEIHPAGLVVETHAALAALVGTRPEEVTKVLHFFRRQGFITFQSYRRRQIRVVDAHGLEAYADRMS